MTWVLRQYRLEDDELLAEHELGTSDAELARILKFEPTKLGSTVLSAEALTQLARAVPALDLLGDNVDPERESFIDFDAEPALLGTDAGSRKAASRASRG